MVVGPVPDEDEGAVAMSGREDKVFSRAARLRRRCELEHVRRCGVNHAARHCAIQVAESPTGERGYAFVVSRRYSSRAVDRNRARRLFRESYRRLLPRLRPAWIVFRPRHAMKGATQGQVESDLCRLLQRAGFMNSEPEDQGV